MRTGSRRILQCSVFTGCMLAAALAAPGYVTQSPISFWPVGNVTWEFNLSTPAGSPNPSVGSPLQDGSTSWDDAVGVALDAYNAVIPDDVLVLVAHKGSGVVPGSADGVNNVAFSDTVYGASWGGSTLAISITRWTGQKRIENDVLFNATKKWDAYTGPTQGGTNDIRRVATHEFGHSLGLNHPDQDGQSVSAIMNSTISSIDGLRQDDIDGVLSLYAAIAPVSIEQHPQSFTTHVGGNWSLSVTATGSETISYDWELSKDGGATWTDAGVPPTYTSLSYSNVDSSQNGWRVRVQVTNPAGTMTSNVATLTVTAVGEAPSITADPQNTTVAEGGTATFSVAASGTPAPALQWQRSTNEGVSFQNVVNGVDGVSGGTTANLQIAPVALALSGQRYRAVATNVSGSAASEAATLTVTVVGQAPSITADPQNTTVAEGGTATFSVAASGTPAPALQWQRSTNGGGLWSDLAEGTIGASGTQSGSLELPLVSADLSGNQFRAVATNVAGTVNSAAATLTVTAATPLASFGAVRADVNASGFAATWDPVFNATGYRIDVSTDADFSSFVSGFQDRDVGNVTDFDVTGLSPGSYYLRVRAYNSEGTGASSEPVIIGLGGRVLNLSTRGLTAEDSEVLIIGFVIKGTQSKDLLIRAAGPSLAPHGVSGTVPNPRIVLFNSAGNAIPPGNDDWNHTDQTLLDAMDSVGAFPYAAPSQDAALLVSLSPGLYTAHVQTVSGEAGVTLVELYELDNTSELINVSTRAFVGEGEAVLIPGTFLGTAPKRVLVRAVGETLGQPPFNVPGVLEDPIIEVVRLNASVPDYTNDDWGSDGNVEAIQAAQQAVSAFELPVGSRDAVVLADLPSGGFTFVVRGKDGATGVVLFELYVVP